MSSFSNALAGLALTAGMFCAVGCSGYNDYEASGDGGSDAPNSDEDSDVDSLDTEDDSEVAVFFGLQGTFDVVDDDLDPSTLALDVALYNNDGEFLCSPVTELLGVAMLDQIDSEDVYSMWQLTLAPSEDPECPWIDPVEFRIGLGLFDPVLRSAVQRAGYDSSTMDVYGLYFQFSQSDPTWVFGIAGTSGNFDGSLLASDAPLQVGEYEALGLYLLPLPQGDQ